MNKYRSTILAASIILLAATIVFAFLGNETIFPATLVGFLLALTLLARPCSGTGHSEHAARHAIYSFSVLVIAFNIVASQFMKTLSDSFHITRHFSEQTTDSGAKTQADLENHFVEVTINDAHELCYSTGILLIIYGGLLLFRRGGRPVNTNCHEKMD